MGVPALFRWLAKKYPKIVQSVEEEEPRTVPGRDGEPVEVPVDTSRANPNGEEFDCLYLDMNGIVHPCTHPEGRPAPETEEEMMAEVFRYTERVVNMIRPRKLLMMAIDGVAPRAKMNQQRSRRFRSAQDAKIAHDQLERDLAERKQRGQAGTDEEVKRAWDSNAITPGTPFMDLLAASLRYWIAHKLNTDPGWKNLCVVLSDASVPGEGEHKIMDYIRRKRSDPHHDPNMKHVIYGLDADLIMLSLATHEPHFKVLREDVFAQESKGRGCHRCGQEGHFAAQCTAEAPAEKKVPAKKPFIFLDVPTLREYLAVELQTPNLPFPFDLERAIDDWVFLIFFVGNDFLPHLPSLEIREGAIDTLLKIWKRELPRMSGYVTNNGRVELANAQYILDGLAAEEDEIFRKRKAVEERQEANRRRNAPQKRDFPQDEGPPTDHDTVEVTQRRPGKPPIPPAIERSAKVVPGARSKNAPIMLDGNSLDVVQNRAQIRMANASAADQLRAELLSKKGTKRSAPGSDPAPKRGKAEKPSSSDTTMFTMDEELSKNDETPSKMRDKALAAVMEGGATDAGDEVAVKRENAVKQEDAEDSADASAGDLAVKNEVNETEAAAGVPGRRDGATSPDGAALKREEDAGAVEQDDDGSDSDDVPPEIAAVERKINADGTVEYEDTVKLWEPGYRQRYYRQKFGVELSDAAFRRELVQAYVEGLCWVLAYYYQGCPSWKWYYPYHYAPFAADFTDLASFKVEFSESEPFRPFEQLMGVLPAASRTNLPPPFQWLMTDPASEIIDFYPTEFQIDMNGKKMAWQGVALLPFIDEARLLSALRQRYDQLTDDETRRNSFGQNVLFVGEDADLYPAITQLYARRQDDPSEPIDSEHIRQVAGSIRPDPSCVPGSTFHTPLAQLSQFGDIDNDRSVSVYYEFPPQRKPHRSVLLRDVKLPPRRLNASDAEWVRRGVPTGGRGPRGRRDDGVMYGRDARPGRGSQGPYGGGPYGGGSYGGGPYGGGPYGGGPYRGGGSAPGPYAGYGSGYSASQQGAYGGYQQGAYGGYQQGAYGGYQQGAYGGYQQGGYGQYQQGPYYTSPYGMNQYGANPGYGAAYQAYGAYGAHAPPHGATNSFGASPYQGAYAYGQAGAAYGSAYGQAPPGGLYQGYGGGQGPGRGAPPARGR